MDKKNMLLSLIEHYSNGNKAQFANRLGITPQGVSTWLKRNTFDSELIFAQCEGLSAQWLLTGKGSMLKDNDIPGEVVYNPNIGIPYYDVDFYGGFSEVYDDQTVNPTCNVVIPGFKRASVWCNVTGHSMEPKINHGDIIALRECTIQDVQFGEIYAVVLDSIRTIKIIRRGSSPDTLLYVPINQPDYQEQEFPIDRIIRIFEVIGSISKFF